MRRENANLLVRAYFTPKQVRTSSEIHGGTTPDVIQVDFQDARSVVSSDPDWGSPEREEPERGDIAAPHLTKRQKRRMDRVDNFKSLVAAAVERGEAYVHKRGEQCPAAVGQGCPMCDGSRHFSRKCTRSLCGVCCKAKGGCPAHKV
jgi:hypothetical protein